MSHTLSNILNGDFNFYQSHFLVRYLYFNWSMAVRYFTHHWFLLTSYCWGKVLAKGKGRTETHFFLSWDLTSKTLLSLVQLKRDRQRKSVRRLCSAVCVCERASVHPSAPVSGFRGAVFQCLVRFTDQPVSPALTAHKLHHQLQPVTFDLSISCSLHRTHVPIHLLRSDWTLWFGVSDFVRWAWSYDRRLMETQYK